MTIEKLAREFRSAIERAKNEGCFKDDIAFKTFPLGCCGDACDLLAQFLRDKENISTYYVCGTFARGELKTCQSHAWLQLKSEIIIDITGDQFRNQPEFLNFNNSVYVGKKSDFHELFDVDKGRIHLTSDIGSLGGSCQSRLFDLYSTIIDYL